jgi:hypothetical protein
MYCLFCANLLTFQPFDSAFFISKWSGNTLRDPFHATLAFFFIFAAITSVVQFFTGTTSSIYSFIDLMISFFEALSIVRKQGGSILEPISTLLPIVVLISCSGIWVSHSSIATEKYPLMTVR